MKPEVRIFQDSESMSREAATLFIEQSAQSIRKLDRFLVSLSGGSTPEHLFELLATDYVGRVDLVNIHLFWDDERCVPVEDAESSYGQAYRIWLSKVAIPQTNIHRINGELKPAEAAKEYATVLGQFAAPLLPWPRFDLVFLGLGEDGHTASLFAGSPLDISQPTLAVTAHYENRPAERVTLTPQVFNTAQMIVFMAAGKNKAEIVKLILDGNYDPGNLPAQRISPKDGKVIWLLDDLAASLIKR